MTEDTMVLQFLKEYSSAICNWRLKIWDYSNAWIKDIGANFCTSLDSLC